MTVLVELWCPSTVTWLEPERRARDLGTVSEVARAISSEMEFDVLLNVVSSVVSERFGYYHVGIAVVEGEEAAYKAGAGALWSDVAARSAGTWASGTPGAPRG